MTYMTMEKDGPATPGVTTSTSSPRTQGGGNPLKRINLQQYGIMLALIAIIIFFQIITGGKLLMANNVSSLIQQNAYVIVLALGMLMIIIAGHIGLSVGSVVAFLGGVMAIAMMHWGLPWPLAVAPVWQPAP